MCQKCVNQFRVITGSSVLNHLLGHVFGVTTAHRASVQSVSCVSAEKASDRLSEVWAQKQYVLPILMFLGLCFGVLVLDLFFSCLFAFYWASWHRNLWGFSQQHVCKLLQGCDLIGYFSCHNQESVHMYLCIPWRPVSGESFCSWNKMWNLTCCSFLTVENLHLHWRRCKTESPACLLLCWTNIWNFYPQISSMSSWFYFFRLIFSTHAEFCPFLQLRI